MDPALLAQLRNFAREADAKGHAALARELVALADRHEAGGQPPPPAAQLDAADLGETYEDAPEPFRELVSRIARRHLHIDTLQERRSDRLDFHDVGVRGAFAGLRAAFMAGAEYGFRRAADRRG